MSLFKRLIHWLVIGAILASLEVYALDRLETVQGPTNVAPMPSAPYKISKAEREELQIMSINFNHGAGLAWRAALIRATLVKANWLANRLNLPMNRPPNISDVQSWPLPPWSLVLVRYPAWFPDTVFGTELYNTNFPRLQRILALKFGLNGNMVTPPYSFSFNDGQLDVVRLEHYAGRMNETPSLTNTAQAYQLATNWLAAVDVNLALLEKSRLPHPVHWAEYQPQGASIAQPVYFVDWGTNYHGMVLDDPFRPTNEWNPAVMVKIGYRRELLELYVSDPNFFRNPPMLIPSKIVWRLVHTPDPPLQYLRTPAGMQEFIMTPEELSQYTLYMTNGVPMRLWLYQHHQLDPFGTMQISNDLIKLNSELIPYTPDTNNATP